ncbi:acyl-CoA thioesterase II [Trebonia kvetii]|uniref:Acyl-CoA thioesterase II n=1 Tax=Trebonia kvetii TaxID=2480626 RepID=A0A6P2CA13_9ACTN|nr:acyl-CoA thioesterase domain-containing protein [Trebonia kvetii]TVZ06761.1 acyl-CoA thioesterase II [Trebonia kvetii]
MTEDSLVETSRLFTAAVTLEPAEPEHFDLAFTAITQACPWPKAYGGDLVAAAAAAAMRSVTDGKTLHSMHSYFLRPVDIGAAVRYEVELLRDGRGYSTRQVRGYQNGKPVYACLASFAAGETGGGTFESSQGETALARAGAIPDPDDLPTSAAYLDAKAGSSLAENSSMTERSRAYWSGGRSFDMRHVPGPVYLTVEGERVPHQAVWVKPYDALRPVPGLSDEQRDVAALAYVCDYTILEPVLRVLDLPWAKPGLVTASLDHAMWFHRPPTVTGTGAAGDWLLYAQEALAADAGRGVGAGKFFTRDHRHLATVVQEGIFRSA